MVLSQFAEAQTIVKEQSGPCQLMRATFGPHCKNFGLGASTCVNCNTQIQW